MPNSIISNKPTIHQFGSHKPYLVAESVASTVGICCMAMFATKAFSFDCPHTIYITTKVIIIVIRPAMNRSMSIRKLLRKEPNLELILASSFFLLFPFLHDFLSVFVLGYKIFHRFWDAE